MARATQQSVGAITVWMIVFAALWLASTVMLVILYTGQEELVADNNRLRQDRQRLVSDQEARSNPFIQNLSDSGPTAVGRLESARRATAQLATGVEEDDPATIRAKVKSLFDEANNSGGMPDGVRLESQSLLEGAKAILVAMKAAAEQRDVLAASVSRLESEVDRYRQSVEDFERQFAEKTKEVTEKLSEVEASRTAYRTERDAAVAELEKEFEQSRSLNTQEVTELREKNAQLVKDLADMKSRVLTQEEKFGSLVANGGTATVRQSDGVVMTAFAGDDAVYINLGESDRLALGLQFAVYPAGDGIPTGMRPKAQIEVSAIYPKSAECRILQTFGNQVIFEGDQISNPVYDPDRPQRFLVVGEFDLNRDGRADRDGGALVESLIAEWGGEVVTELTAATDFVVVGIPPRRPLPAEGRVLSAEQAERRASMEQAWTDYNDTVQKATSLSVPVLTQDLFVNLLGYRER